MQVMDARIENSKRHLQPFDHNLKLFRWEWFATISIHCSRQTPLFPPCMNSLKSSARSLGIDTRVARPGGYLLSAAQRCFTSFPVMDPCAGRVTGNPKPFPHNNCLQSHVTQTLQCFDGADEISIVLKNCLIGIAFVRSGRMQDLA